LQVFYPLSGAGAPVFGFSCGGENGEIQLTLLSPPFVSPVRPVPQILLSVKELKAQNSTPGCWAWCGNNWFTDSLHPTGPGRRNLVPPNPGRVAAKAVQTRLGPPPGKPSLTASPAGTQRGGPRDPFSMAWGDFPSSTKNSSPFAPGGIAPGAECF